MCVALSAAGCGSCRAIPATRIKWPRWLYSALLVQPGAGSAYQLGWEISACLPDLEAHQVTVVGIAVDQTQSCSSLTALPRSQEQGTLLLPPRPLAGWLGRLCPAQDCRQ